MIPISFYCHIIVFGRINIMGIFQFTWFDCWTIIEINDTRYVFDTSLDRHVKERTKKVTYSKFFKTEKEVKKSYKLSYYHSDAWPVQFSTKNFGYIWY